MEGLKPHDLKYTGNYIKIIGRQNKIVQTIETFANIDIQNTELQLI